MNLPTISIIIPTLNSSSTLGFCLDSILMQDYPMDRLEIIIADGGSTDGTLEIINLKLSRPAGAGAPNYKLFPNLLRTGEAGKALGVKRANNEIIALIDSDNILPYTDWLRRMVEPFQDKEIVASEPLYYTYRKTDSYITRYCALLGMNDPLCLWLGNYDRYCGLTGRWTECPHSEEDKGDYLKISFRNFQNLPTIGANGFLIRREIFQQYHIGEYLFDIDIMYDLVSSGPYKIAKLKIGIIHLYAGKVSQFIKKQRRRVRDYNYYNKLGLRKYPWGSINRTRLIKFCVDTIFIVPLMVQVFKGIIKKKDSAWLFHPIACIFTFLVYAISSVVKF